MKMHKFLTVTLVSLVFLAFFNVAIFADEEEDGGCPMGSKMGSRDMGKGKMECCEHGNMGEKMGMFMDKVTPKLTDDQKTKIKNIFLDSQKEKIQMRADLEIKNLELKELMMGMIDNPDENAINAKIDEIGKIRTDMQKKMISTMLAARNVLTDEQKASLKKGMKEGKKESPMSHKEKKETEK